MPLHPTLPKRERILIYGPWGSGKSECWLDIARWIQRTGSPAHVHLQDTDDGWGAMRPTDGSLDKIVIPYASDTWDGVRSSMPKIMAATNPAAEDWWVIDMIGTVWALTADGFAEQMFGKDLDAWYLEVKGKVAGDYGSNYGIINKMYNAVASKIPNYPGHVLCCTGEEVIRQPDKQGKGGDDLDTRESFSGIGSKPAGQKNVGHLFHTVIHSFVTRGKGGLDDEYGQTMVKERHRDRPGKWTQAQVGSFVMEYLVSKGQWGL